MKIKEINELLTKAFQQTCYLEDEKFKFPNISNVTKFEKVKDDCEKFLSQYDIKVGAGAILYPEGNKIFVVQINKLPFNKFLEKIADLSRDMQLYDAVKQGATSNVKMLLDEGANFNHKNIFGNTVLHIAIENNYIGIVNLLVERGAVINIPNDKAESALQLIEQKSDTALGIVVIKALLKKDSIIEKPAFTLQKLSDYWDEQLNKKAEKSFSAAVAQGIARGMLETTPKEPKIKNMVSFFSAGSRTQTPHSTDVNEQHKQAEKKQRSGNLGR